MREKDLKTSKGACSRKLGDSHTTSIKNHWVTYYKHLERFLGFETKAIFPQGLSSEKVQMVQTKNTRKTDIMIEKGIRTYWKKNSQHNMFDGDRARYEGICYDEKRHELGIFYSHEKYKTYFYTANMNLSRSYQAELLSINGVVITKDNLIPIGLRTAQTNHMGIWHIVPAGYIDIERAVDDAARKERPTLPEVWSSETPYAATERELQEELAIPKECVDASKMKLIGVVFNYNRDYDTTVCVAVPVDCHSSEIALRGEEHQTMRFLKTSLNDLKEELIQLSKDRSTSSGHLRGDIALTIAHLYGCSQYVKTLESVAKEASKSR